MGDVADDLWDNAFHKQHVHNDDDIEESQMANEITDEMVELAAKAMWTFTSKREWGDCLHQSLWLAYARAALEAIAPALRAQGMREIARLPHTKETTFMSVRDLILARAELEEQGK